jgi:hydrogenase maturation protein HypF
VNAPVQRLRAVVRGVVQGVGFRPFVYRLARAHSLVGVVYNDARGAVVEVEGQQTDAFFAQLRQHPPPLARIDSVDLEALPLQRSTEFVIAQSVHGGPVQAPVTADAGLCDDCLAELCEPTARRFRYPFLNCTNCGPRYTITRALPYDRPQTTLADFPLCAACQAEYDDPRDRRFHAQPIACPVCGPVLSDSLDTIWATLRAGRIVALKGLGGYLLALDARNEAAVARLRARKHRDGKPFAVMVANLESARAIAHLTEQDESLLTSSRRPIVVLPGRGVLAPSIAPGLQSVGVMLPPTPLQLLLFHEACGRPAGTTWLEGPVELVLVMTSANPSGAPIIIDDQVAGRELERIADLIVTHNRPIAARADDSVMRCLDGVPTLIRRSRGWVPEGIRLPQGGPSVLALGAHLKSTICVTRGAEAFLSPHIGDLDDADTLRFHQEASDHLLRVLGLEPRPAP